MEYLIIDPSTRKITIPKSEQLFGVYGEGNIERKYFKCPKIVGDNVDLSDCYIFVNYYTAKGLPGKYTVRHGLARQTGMSGNRVCMDGKRYKGTRQSER